LVQLRTEKALSFNISVDGGVNQKTVNDVLSAGTDIVVSGSSFFKGELSWKF
jgi:ribulose-phosphate 3-epimerase